MILNPKLFMLSSAITAIVLWTLYTIAVASLTFLAINLSGDMAYLNLRNFDWPTAFSRFIVGLIVWVGIAAGAGWLAATIYNSLERIGSGLK